MHNHCKLITWNQTESSDLFVYSQIALREFSVFTKAVTSLWVKDKFESPLKFSQRFILQSVLWPSVHGRHQALPNPSVSHHDNKQYPTEVVIPLSHITLCHRILSQEATTEHMVPFHASCQANRRAFDSDFDLQIFWFAFLLTGIAPDPRLTAE